jgi:hypothetical protein
MLSEIRLDYVRIGEARVRVSCVMLGELKCGEFIM